MSSFIVAGQTITLVVNGSAYVVDPSHQNYEAIKTGLSVLTDDELEELANVPKAVASFIDGKAEIHNGTIYFNGEPIHSSLTERILDLMDQGFPFEPMLRFLENLMQNPSAQSISELYDFLTHKGLPITEDGCFLGYKVVRPDYMDKFSGRIDNHPGQVVEFHRGKVDDRREHECSFGLHVGCLDYIKWYGHEGDKVLLVKVNPKDAVSVPKDHQATKLRVCCYEVLSDYQGEIELQSKTELLESCYNSKGEEFDDDEYDEDNDDYYDPCVACEREDCNGCRLDDEE